MDIGTTPDLGKRLFKLFPGISPGTDFIWDGERIEFWNEKKLGPLPSLEDIIAVDLSPSTDERRKAEYEKQGVTIEALTVAIVEHLIEGKPEALAALQVKREAIKVAIQSSSPAPLPRVALTSNSVGTLI